VWTRTLAADFHDFVIRFVNPAITKIPEINDSMLNERQKKFFDDINKENITTKDYIELTGCTKRTAIRDLAILVKQGLIIQKGPVTGRGRYYVIKVTKGDKRCIVLIKNLPVLIHIIHLDRTIDRTIINEIFYLVNNPS